MRMPPKAKKMKLDTSGDVPQAGQDGHIDVLNDDCLLHVYSYLSVKDHLECEQVCKRWMTLTLQQWKSVRMVTSSLLRSALDVSLGTALDVLSRTCENALEIEIPDCTANESHAMLAYIADHAEKLQTLKTRSLTVNDQNILLLFLIWGQIRSQIKSGVSQAFLSLDSPYVDVVSLISIEKAIGFIQSLRNQTLSFLNMEIKMSTLAPQISRVSVQAGMLNNVPCHILYRLIGINTSLVSSSRPSVLKSCINMRLPGLNETSWKYLTWLRELMLVAEHGQLSSNEFYLYLSSDMANQVKLNISPLNRNMYPLYPLLKDVILQAVTSMRNVTRIIFSHCPSVSDLILCVLAQHGNLQFVKCFCCPNVTDIGAISILDSCPNLKVLDFTGCTRITDSTVAAAVAASWKLTTNTDLKIFVGGTGVRGQASNMSHSRLHVIFSVTSNAFTNEE